MPDLRVEEFEIHVIPGESQDDERSTVVVSWRDKERQGHVDLDGLRLRTVRVLVGMLRSNRLKRIEELRLLGEHLYAILFGVSVSEHGPSGLLMRAIKDGSVEDEGGRRLLRVSLEIGGRAESLLSSLPWEYLYIPNDPNDRDTGFFLGERANFVLTRQLPLTGRQPAIDIRPPLRILLVVLSPKDMEVEYEAVLETLLQLDDSKGHSRIDLRVLAEDRDDDGSPLAENERDPYVRSSYPAFRNTVEDFDPHVIHIIGHGRYHTDPDVGAAGELAFLHSDHTANWIADQELANGLRDVSSLRLVFLQACESAEAHSNPYQVISGLAQWLAQRIPAVIAMHFQVKSMMANEFARSFYRSMVNRSAIEVAMHAARRALYTGGLVGDTERSGFGLPVLYLRGSGALLPPLEVPSTSLKGGAPESRIPDLSRAWGRDVGNRPEQFPSRSAVGGAGAEYNA